MKIVYGITKSNFGGAQRYIFDLASEAKRRGHEVKVICGKTGLLTDKLDGEKIDVISIPSMWRDISIVSDIKSFFQIVRILRKERPDVFHVNSSKMGGLGSLAGRLVGIEKIVFTAHGWPFWEKRDFVSVALITFFSWLTAILSHRVIVISDYDLHIAERMPFVRRKTTRIYNGIDLHMTFGTGDKIRGAFPPGKKIVGTIGELNTNKNQIALVEEARENPEMFVAIVGEGEKRDFFERKIREYRLEDRVKLFGFVPREEALRGFDIFALPSLKEGLPYVLLEAKLLGLPIETKRIGGIGEILEQDINNFSIEKMCDETFATYLR